MKGIISSMSALLLITSGAALAQQPAPEQPQQQPPVERPEADRPDVQPRPDGRDIAAADRPTGEFLTNRERGQIRSDELVGANVMDSAGENVASVNELLIDEDGRVAALIIDVGGVLGIGATQVALRWDAVEIRRDEDDGVFQDRYEVHTNMTQEQLEQAPEFQDDEDDWF